MFDFFRGGERVGNEAATRRFELCEPLIKIDRDDAEFSDRMLRLVNKHNEMLSKENHVATRYMRMKILTQFPKSLYVLNLMGE